MIAVVSPDSCRAGTAYDSRARCSRETCRVSQPAGLAVSGAMLGIEGSPARLNMATIKLSLRAERVGVVDHERN